MGAETFETGGVLFYGDKVTDTGATQLWPLGTIREQDGSRYRYVKYDDGDSIACLADHLAGFIKDEEWTITLDVSDSDVTMCAGSPTAAIADGEYGWVQTQGFKTLADSAGAVGAVGDLLGWVADDGGDVEIKTAAEANLGTVAGVCTKDTDASNTFILLKLQ